MIEFDNLSTSTPYKKFKKFYKKAEEYNQKNIEAACLSTIALDSKPRSRFINIKYIIDNKFIFFSNFKSNKAKEIKKNNQISLNFFWSSINSQVRIEGKISKISDNFANEHWKQRATKKNALAISSRQSQKIKSYDQILINYNHVLKNYDLSIRPDYWGGYSIEPEFFEFWEGDSSRINIRKEYRLFNNMWDNSTLEP